MSLSFTNFQIIVHKSDPRTVLIFNQSISSIWPHAVTVSRDRNCDLVRYPPLGSKLGRNQGGSDEEDEEDQQRQDVDRTHAAGGASNATRILRGGSQQSSLSATAASASAAAALTVDTSFQEVFDDCFDNGKWLLIDNMSLVSHGAWRYVGQRLAAAVPAREYLMRKHFRLFTFLSPGLEPHTLAPTLLCQYAMIVDISGEVHAKSEVGPLFEGDASLIDISSTLASAKKALLGTGAAAPIAPVENVTKNDETNRLQPYLSVSQSRRKLQAPSMSSFDGGLLLNGSALILHKSCGSVNSESEEAFGGTQGSNGGGIIDLDDPDRPGALEEQYIEELVSCLKEDLLVVQADMIESTNEQISVAVAEADAKAAHNMAGAQFGDDDSDDDGGLKSRGHPSERDQDDKRKALFDGLTRQANANYDWIYPTMAQWVLTQSPQVNFKIIPRIHDETVSVEGVVWQNYSQMCHSATWNGSEVLLHTPVATYTTHAAEKLKDEMRREAATHFNVRHPSVLAFYGVLAKDECSLITESGIGSLEQALVRTRLRFNRWTVRHFLSIAQQVLQGLTYLSTTMTHRDIACRSIVEVREKGPYKIGRFGLAQSIKGYSGDDDTKVAVRWSAPEALTGVFSTKSDMWSFGMLMWECIHYATALPYANSKQAGDTILSGEIEQCYTPAAAPLFNMICIPCFEEDPDKRPHAASLLTAVERAMLQWDLAVLDREVPFPNENKSSY